VLDQSVADEGLKAFEEAMALAENDDVRRRVEKASICAWRMAAEDACIAAFGPEEFQKRGLSTEDAERQRPIVRHLLELCEKYGVEMAAENVPVEEARKRLREAFGLKEDEKF